MQLKPALIGLNTLIIATAVQQNVTRVHKQGIPFKYF
jgi:hypothetical protein